MDGETDRRKLKKLMAQGIAVEICNVQPCLTCFIITQETNLFARSHVYL